MSLKEELSTLLLELLGEVSPRERTTRLSLGGLSFLRSDGSGAEVVDRVVQYFTNNGPTYLVRLLQGWLAATFLTAEQQQWATALLAEIKPLSRAAWVERITGVTPTHRSVPSTLGQKPHSGGQKPEGNTIDSGGGAAINGNVTAGGHFVGRDLIMGQQNYHITVGGEVDVNQLLMAMAQAARPTLPTIAEQIRLDVATPATVRVKQPFAIGVAIKQHQSPPLTVQDLPDVTSAEGEVYRCHPEEIIQYRVEVSSSDCEIPTPSYTFLLKAGADSQVRYFEVTARRSGRIALIVNAYQEDAQQKEWMAASTRVRVEATLEAEAQ